MRYRAEGQACKLTGLEECANLVGGISRALMETSAFCQCESGERITIMNKRRFLGKLIAMLVLCCLVDCKTRVDQPTSSNAAPLPLTTALLSKSDMSNDWHWYFEQDAPTTISPVTQTQALPTEVTSRVFRGYWQIRENDVLIGHTLNRYIEQSTTLPEITSTDLLDYPKDQFYSPNVIKVGKAQLAVCAPSPNASVWPPVLACKVIVQYDHVSSVVQITSQVSMRAQVEEAINQILKATDVRIQPIAQAANP